MTRLEDVDEAGRDRRSWLHVVRYDDPSARSHRAQRAICGRLVSPQEVARTAADVVSCPDCARLEAEFEALDL